MKKTSYLLILAGLILAVASCTRSEIADPTWNDPAGFYILLEGSANPAVFFVDGNIHTSQVIVRLTDSKGNRLAGRTIFFEQLRDSLSHQQIDWGYFENNAPTILKATDANGEVRVTYYSGVKYLTGHIYIHALMQVDGQAYRGSSSHVGSVPQDFITITMINSSGSGAEAAH